MHVDTDDHAGLVRPVAPGVIDALDDRRIAGLEDRLVRVGHQVYLTIRHGEQVAGVCPVHTGIACQILLGWWVLLLDLVVHLLQDLGDLLGVLDMRGNLQGTEDQPILLGLTDGDVRSTISRGPGCSPGAPL
jgi:hypothetical protein